MFESWWVNTLLLSILFNILLLIFRKQCSKSLFFIILKYFFVAVFSLHCFRCFLEWIHYSYSKAKRMLFSFFHILFETESQWALIPLSYLLIWKILCGLNRSIFFVLTLYSKPSLRLENLWKHIEFILDVID